MKLQSLEVENFKNHSHTKIEFANLTLLVGKAGAGKSSLLDAIALCLAGKNRHTDQRGAGMGKQVKKGTHGFSLGVSLQNGTGESLVVARTCNGEKQELIVPWGTDLKGRQALLLDKLGVSDDTIEVLLDPRLFADRDPDSQRKALLKLVRQPVITVPEAAKAVGIKALTSIEDIDQQIKTLKDSNIRALNSSIKYLEEHMPAEVTALKLAEYTKLKAKHGAAEQRRAQYERHLGSISNELVTSKKQAEQRAQAERWKVELVGLEQARPKLESQVQKCTAEAKKWRQLVDASSQEVGKTGYRLASVNESIANFEKLIDCCPTCLRKITATEIGSIGSQLAEQRKSALEVHEATRVAGKENQERFDKANEKFVAACEALAANTTKAGTLKMRIESSEATKAGDPAELEKLLAEAKQQVQDSTREAAELKAKLDELDILKRQQDERTANLAEVEETRKKREAYLMAVESLEAAKLAMLGGNEAQRFKDEVARLWCQFYAGTTVNIEPSGVSVTGVEPEPILASFLSSGQKVILDAAIRVAAAKTSGFGILAMDDANKLPKDTREQLLVALMKSGVQCILAHTSSQPSKSGGTVRSYFLRSETLQGPVTVEEGR